MLTAKSCNFNRCLDIQKRVSNDVITEEYIRYFDNDGFELSFLEQEYYRENKIRLAPVLNHACDQQEWLVCKSDKFKLDHSLILQRWSFVGEARQQLETKKVQYPQLNKYLKLHPKWGIDFALEYYDGDTSLEVLHIEIDYRNFYEATAAKSYLEEKLIATDWEDFTTRLLLNKSKWEGLNGMEQNDWKAVFWGLKRAERTYKAFA